MADLRDAAVAAGYACNRWRQDNAVQLAAESGSCSGDSVLSTYASHEDLQSQLGVEKDLAGMLTDLHVEQDPMLVGPNWILKAPQAPELQDSLGGVVVSPKS